MRKTFLFSMLIFLLAGCNKDKFTTVPKLTYESVNTKILGRNQTLSFTLSFTDAEGDLAGNVTVQKLVKRCLNGDDGSFTQDYAIPTFPSGKNQAGDLIVTFSYVELNPLCSPRNDTALFKFVLKDKANNVSDTATSDAIVITN